MMSSLKQTLLYFGNPTPADLFSKENISRLLAKQGDRSTEGCRLNFDLKFASRTIYVLEYKLCDSQSSLNQCDRKRAHGSALQDQNSSEYVMYVHTAVPRIHVK